MCALFLARDRNEGRGGNENVLYVQGQDGVPV